MRKKKNAEAEKLFRRAVRAYAKYGVAWLTLGQLLVAEADEKKLQELSPTEEITEK